MKRSPRFARRCLCSSLAALGLAMLLPERPSQAALRAYEGFEGGPGNLQGRSSGFGFSGTWRNTTGNVTVTDPGLTYPNVETRGSKVAFDPTGYDAISIRNLSAPISQSAGGNTWIAFLAQRTNGTAGRRYIGLGLRNGGDDNSQQVLFFGANHPAAAAVWRVANNSGGVNTTKSVDTLSLVVARIQWNASGPETVSLFVNPDPATTPTTPDAQYIVEVGGFDRIRIGAGSTSGSYGETQGVIDEISIADTYAEAVAAQKGWASVPLGGGGKVTGLACSPDGSDIYIRTDVGGAFRWEPASETWVSLSDTIVSGTTYRARDYIGSFALAISPHNPQNLYLAAGGSGYGGIYSSTNRGTTWTKISVSTPIPVDSNRNLTNAAGERLVVDPNNANRLWYGSSQNGLYLGTQSGGNWTWSAVPSTSVPVGAVASGYNVGVGFVACDDVGSSTTVYAGVYDSVGTTGGVYRSTDGTSWSRVMTVQTPMRGEVSPDGTLYVTCHATGTIAGSVWKMPRNGTPVAITPSGTVAPSGTPNFVALAVGSGTAGNVVCVAEYFNDGFNNVWRSEDGGASWRRQNSNFNAQVWAPRKESDGTVSVGQQWFPRVSDLMMNPANPNDLWCAHVFGVNRTLDAQNLGVGDNGCTWFAREKNLEETVVLSLGNASSGASLLAGFADVGGFRYTDTTKRPVEGGGMGGGGSTFSKELGGAWAGLANYPGDPQLWAATLTYGVESHGSGAISRDNGQTWRIFGTVVHKSVTNSATAGLEAWDVTSYISRQAAEGAGAVNLLLCSGSTGGPYILSFDSRHNASAALRPRLEINGGAIVRYAVQDTFVSTTATTTNYGTDATLQVSKRDKNVEKRWTYLRFDVSGLGVVSSAQLVLNRRAAANTQKFEVGVFNCPAAAWVEGNGGTDNVPAGEINWGTRPIPLASTDTPTNSDPTTNPRYLGGLFGGRVAFSAADPDRLVWVPTGTTKPLQYSADGGATWKPGTGAPNSTITGRFTPSIMIQPLAADSLNGNFYLAKFNESGGGRHHVYTSTNGGATFTFTGSASGGSSNPFRCQLMAAPEAAGDLWMCDDGVDNPTASGGLWRSTNAGATWSKFPNVRSAGPMAFGRSPTGMGYSVFFAGYLIKPGNVMEPGIYRSDDYGATWVRMEDFATISQITWMAGDRQKHGKVYVGTAGRGIFESK